MPQKVSPLPLSFHKVLSVSRFSVTSFGFSLYTDSSPLVYFRFTNSGSLVFLVWQIRVFLDFLVSQIQVLRFFSFDKFRFFGFSSVTKSGPSDFLVWQILVLWFLSLQKCRSFQPSPQWRREKNRLIKTSCRHMAAKCWLIKNLSVGTWPQNAGWSRLAVGTWPQNAGWSRI